MKQLEEDNLATNGVALRDTLRDAGNAMMKQVKEKIEQASASASASGSRESSRAPSLIDFEGQGLSSPDHDRGVTATLISSPTASMTSSASSQLNLQPSSMTTIHHNKVSHDQQQPPRQPHQHPRPEPDIAKIQEQLVMIKRERDSLHLRNSQLCNLIEDLKRELSEERSLRKDLEEEYKRRSEDIPFKVLLDKNIQTDKIQEKNELMETKSEEQSPGQNMSLDRDNERQERDSLMLRNAELSSIIEQLKGQLKEDSIERREVQDELSNLKTCLKDKESESTLKQKDIDRLECLMKSLQQELAQERLDRQQEVKRMQQEIEDQQREPIIREEVMTVTKHKEIVTKLEESLSEKNKTIKLQQQRITDIKKSIQRGDFVASTTGSNSHALPTNHNNQAGYCSDNDSQNKDRENSPATLPVGSSALHPLTGDNVTVTSLQQQTSLDSCNDHAVTTLSVNFEYLKNVVYKFITSSDYESQKQLIKAIATLLQFNREQETVIRETLDWRNSWVASIPLVGSNLKPLSAVTASSTSTTNSSDRRRRSRSRGKK